MRKDIDFQQIQFDPISPDHPVIERAIAGEAEEKVTLLSQENQFEINSVYAENSST